MANNMVEIKKFLSTPDKPVSSEEMMAFWKSLSEEEKEYYRNSALDNDG